VRLGVRGPHGIRDGCRVVFRSDFWGCWVLILVAALMVESAQRSEVAKGLFWVLIGAAIAAWYFYEKENVVRYYDELKARA
jgi:hypothetical protein